MAATGAELWRLTMAAERAAGKTTRAAYIVRSWFFSSQPSSANINDRELWRLTMAAERAEL